jgi:gas vesicle protein
MERNNNQNQSNGSGFLLGVIIGVLLTLLLTTKKGRAILKEVMEKGIEKFADLEEIMQDTAKDFDDLDDEDDDFIASKPIEIEEPPVEKKEPPKKQALVEEKEDEEEIPAEPVHVKKETTITKTVKEFEKEEKEEKEEKGEKAAVENPPEENTKPKTVRGRRWFRGLRKKG